MPRDEGDFAQSAGISSCLANFALRTGWSDIPEDIRRRAQHHILDATGIALAAGTFDFADRSLDGIQAMAGGSGNVGVIGKGITLPPRDAAARRTS